LTKATPGLVQGLYYLAKVKFVCGKTEQAKMCLDKVLEKEPSHFEANLLMPQIYLKVNDFEEANQFLAYGMNTNSENSNILNISFE
jgi:tetratricopeptide repeat protein 21B